MEVPEGLQHRIESWENLSRWERSEVGRDLRRLGMSYGEIRALIEVKKSTLANWCRDIELTDEQHSAIMKRTGSRAGIPVDTQWRRRLEIESIRDDARAGVRQMISDPYWVAGVVLYWAEGNKTGSRLGLSNSDPRVVRLFVAWCRAYHTFDASFVLKLNLHADNDEGAARKWWARESGLEDPRFHKTFIKPDGTGHRKNHLPNGVCMVRMCRSADAFHRTLAWVDEMAATYDGSRGKLQLPRAAGAIGSAVDS